MGIVLCPTDFSNLSRDAIGFASEVARKRHDKLIIMHVRPHLDHSPPALGLSSQSAEMVIALADGLSHDFQESIDSQSLTYRENDDDHAPQISGESHHLFEDEADAQIIARLRQSSSDMDCEVMVREGDPVEEILKVAKSESVSQIIMGTFGRPGFRKVILGHISEQIAQRAPCPVTVIRNPDCLHCNQ